MDEQDPLWQFLKQAAPSKPDGSLAPRTLARLALEKSRRRRWAKLGRALALLLVLACAGGGSLLWVTGRRSVQEADLTHAAFSSIASTGVEDVGWLQGQLSPEAAEKGETVLWEEASSF
ncbi:MAG: hypothetical protein AB7T14_02955 [Candidatus Methylacidiphilaceae bacterium]